MAQSSTKRAKTLTESDGEIVGQIFCTYCGNLNETDAQDCTSCGHYIADQGPDLSARLLRIRRYASQSPELDGKRESNDALMGVDAPAHEAKRAVRHITFGPYSKANFYLLTIGFILGVTVVAIFNAGQRGLAISVFLAAALFYPIGGFLLTVYLKKRHWNSDSTDDTV